MLLKAQEEMSKCALHEDCHLWGQKGTFNHTLHLLLYVNIHFDHSAMVCAITYSTLASGHMLYNTPVITHL